MERYTDNQKCEIREGQACPHVWNNGGALPLICEYAPYFCASGSPLLPLNRRQTLFNLRDLLPLQNIVMESGNISWGQRRRAANLIYIRDLLGHESIVTTEVYAKVDSDAKRAALNNAYQSAAPILSTSWKQDAKLINWLKNLGPSA